MSKKGDGKFNLSEIGKVGARNENVRRTARSFFTTEAEPTSQIPEPTERRGDNESTPPVDTSRGRDSSGGKRGKGDGRDEARATVMREDATFTRRATWRAPREDGRLRTNDKAVLDYLWTRLAEEGDTTEEVGMREIAKACEVSHRTAQNTVLRLQDAKIISRIPPALGSNKGCRYRILKGAPRSRFARTAN